MARSIEKGPNLAGHCTGQYVLNGSLDDVRIYRKAISQMVRKVFILLLVLFLSSVCFGTAANMAVMQTSSGDASGNGWGNAMGLVEFYTDVNASAEVGDVYYVAGGTYTLTGNWAIARSGTAALPISVIGVKTGTTNWPPVASDCATEPNDPLSPWIDANTFNFGFSGDYWIFKNLRVETKALSGFRTYAYAIVQNCLSHNISATIDQVAFFNNTGDSTFIGCEASCDKGPCFSTYKARILNCYAHDSVGSGFFLTTTNNILIGNKTKNCGTGLSAGINVVGTFGNYIANNTIYNSATGIRGTTGHSNTFVNNIISNCTNGALWTTNELNNYWNYNCFGNNTYDVNLVTTGAKDLLATDPQFVDAANGDFRLKSTSPCLNNGMPTWGGGFTDIGAWQPASCESVPSGDLNNDFRVDFYDFAEMAKNWLIDCILDPNDPACVPE
jgi:hypothetical protein